MSRSIVITGASGGIGRALAAEYAGPGTHLLLFGRDAERLAAVVAEVEAKGATVEESHADVRDTVAMAAVLADFDARHPVDLLIANAGVSAGLEPGKNPEAAGVSRRLMEINYGGMLNTVEPLLPRFMARRGGRIVLVSSLAGLRALPDMPSYSATKAAVRAYGISLRGWLRPVGVGVTVVHPGFVTSPMSARHGGAKPFEWSAEKAARHIRRKVDAGRTTVAFPFPLVAGITASKFLPPALSDWFMRPYSAEITPDDRKD
jgi:short-subunit dehydrogenase